MGVDVMNVCMYLPVESWGHESPGWKVEPLLEEEGLDAKRCRWQGPEAWQDRAPPRVGKRFGLKWSHEVRASFRDMHHEELDETRY